MGALLVSVRAADPQGGASVEVATTSLDDADHGYADEVAREWATEQGYAVDEVELDENGATVYVETTDAVARCSRAPGHGPAVAGSRLCPTCLHVDAAELRRNLAAAVLASAPTDEHGVPYVDRWQYADALAAAGRTPTCDVCSWVVAPISGGWAHSHRSADALVTHDWSATAHEATVLGQAR